MKTTATTILLISLVLPAFTQTAYDNLPAVAQTEPAYPVDVTRFEIHGAGRDMFALIYLRNRGIKTIKGVEYEFDTYDSELRIHLSRYYLIAGKIPHNDTGLGKPIEPGKTKALHGYVSRRLAVLYSYWTSGGEDIRINVLHFTDGTKWERKGWQKENPN